MRNSKKIFTLTLCIILSCLLAAVLSGCSDDTHTHTFEERWSSNATHHYVAANCEHSDVKGYEAEHIWNNEHKCTVCNYQGEHGYSNWVKTENEDTHSKSCACGSVITDNCSGGTADCADKAVCTVCGGAWGALDKNNHKTPDSYVYTNCGDSEHSYNYACCAKEVSREAHNMSNGKCTKCGYSGYVRVNASNETAADGGYILFGSYPQKRVSSVALTNQLSSLAGMLPSATNNQSWTPYGYYIGNGDIESRSDTTAYMWYIDITHEGEKYRGVYFTSYRPDNNYGLSSADTSAQDNNGYTLENAYWFKYEPVKWRILSVSGGKALIVCDMVIDAQDYQSSASDYTKLSGTPGNYYVLDGSGNIVKDGTANVYANNYAYSTVRGWLNDTFYNTAFGDLQKGIISKTVLDNSKNTTHMSSSVNAYACKNTEDNVFLLSYHEAVGGLYGFNEDGGASDTARKKPATDYAKCQGLGVANDGTANWWLRSPNAASGFMASYVNGGVADYSYPVTNTSVGVCPALYIQL